MTALRSAARRIACAALLTTLALARTIMATEAHSERPANIVWVDAGAYPLLVALYADPAPAGERLPLLISPAADARAKPTEVQVVARPGLGTNATATRGTFTPDPDSPGSFEGAVLLPVTGAWTLEIVVDGVAGEGRAYVPLTAATPGAIPLALGWALGLTPLAGVLWLGWWSHRYLRRLETTTSV